MHLLFGKRVTITNNSFVRSVIRMSPLLPLMVTKTLVFAGCCWLGLAISVTPIRILPVNKGLRNLV